MTPLFGRFGHERVPARELLELLAGAPDSWRISLAFGADYTVGELRELAERGQAVDVPRDVPDLWRVEVESDGRRLWDPE